MRISSSRKTALAAAQAAIDHKAKNVCILNVSKICDYADCFLIMSGTSTRHTKALAESILESKGMKVTAGIEGYSKGEWILLDLGDVVVHIFHEPIRSYYSFDKLWGDAPTISVPQESVSVSRRVRKLAPA